MSTAADKARTNDKRGKPGNGAADKSKAPRLPNAGPKGIVSEGITPRLTVEPFARPYLITPALVGAEARHGDNDLDPFGPTELHLYSGTQSAPPQHKRWDPAGLGAGLDSGEVPVSLSVWVKNSTTCGILWNVDGTHLTLDGAGYKKITAVQLVAGVELPAAVRWKDVVVAFGGSSGPPLLTAPVSEPQVDQRLDPNYSGAEARLWLSVPGVNPTQPGYTSVTVSGKLQLLADPGAWLGENGAYAQVYVYTA